MHVPPKNEITQNYKFSKVGGGGGGGGVCL